MLQFSEFMLSSNLFFNNSLLNNKLPIGQYWYWAAWQAIFFIYHYLVRVYINQNLDYNPHFF